MNVEPQLTVGLKPLVSSGPQLSDETFHALRRYISEHMGIYFQDKKKYLLEGRLAKRLRVLKLFGFEEYLHLLQYSQHREEEHAFLYDATTINETFFFRHEAQLEAIEKTLIPSFMAARQQDSRPKLRIWSSACSSGEEPYSIAMVLLQKTAKQFPSLSVEIVATDVSPGILAAAERGVYNRYAIRNLPNEYLTKYFVASGDQFVLNDEVKRMVRFQHLNLFDRNQIRWYRNFDIILCCNVLIYFDLGAKTQVVGDLYSSLNKGGHLFIGSSELLHGVSAAFKLVSLPKTVAYKKE